MTNQVLCPNERSDNIIRGFSRTFHTCLKCSGWSHLQKAQSVKWWASSSASLVGSMPACCRVCLLVEPLIKKEQCSFYPSHGTLDLVLLAILFIHITSLLFSFVTPCYPVVEVNKVSGRNMSLNLEIKRMILNVVSTYAPQVGCQLEKKKNSGVSWIKW